MFEILFLILKNDKVFLKIPIYQIISILFPNTTSKDHQKFVSSSGEIISCPRARFLSVPFRLVSVGVFYCVLRANSIAARVVWPCTQRYVSACLLYIYFAPMCAEKK